MANVKNFRKLKVWLQGMEIAREVFQLVAHLPNSEVYGLRSQLTRSAVSIPSNIAEGSGRSSDKGFIRFLEYSLGSAYELETQLILMKDLCPEQLEELDLLIAKLIHEQSMISKLIGTVKTNNLNE